MARQTSPRQQGRRLSRGTRSFSNAMTRWRWGALGLLLLVSTVSAGPAGTAISAMEDAIAALQAQVAKLQADLTALAARTYPLTLTPSGTGQGTVAPLGAAYAAGAQVTLTATPASRARRLRGGRPPPVRPTFRMPASALTCTATFTAAVVPRRRRRARPGNGCPPAATPTGRSTSRASRGTPSATWRSPPRGTTSRGASIPRRTSGPSAG